MISVKSSHVETYRNPTIQTPSALTITYRNHTQRTHSNPTLSAKTLHNATSCALTDLTSSALPLPFQPRCTIPCPVCHRSTRLALPNHFSTEPTSSALPIRNITDYARPNHVCHNCTQTNVTYLTASAIAQHFISNHNLTRPVCHRSWHGRDNAFQQSMPTRNVFFTVLLGISHLYSTYLFSYQLLASDISHYLSRILSTNNLSAYWFWL